jgi:hypothetical protein
MYLDTRSPGVARSRNEAAGGPWGKMSRLAGGRERGSWRTGGQAGDGRRSICRPVANGSVRTRDSAHSRKPTARREADHDGCREADHDGRSGW